MLHLPAPMLLGSTGAAPGQVQWASDSELITSWVVPDGVTSISAVCIGRGEDGYLSQAEDTAASGKGGNLRYVNSIVVSPGEVLSITIDRFSSAVRRDSTLLVGAGAIANGGGNDNLGTGFNGGARVSGGYYNSASGPGAGGYTSVGANSTSGSKGGGGSNLLGGGAGASAGSSSTVDGQDFGGGAGVIWSDRAGKGGRGGIRIIWGPGRAYPNTNTGDV